jgi:DNA-binding response OmpR family regulator
MLLDTLGHETRAVTTGTGALTEADVFQPDIAILDIGLPDLSGYEVARALRAKRGTTIYIAAVTGWAQPEDRVKSLAAGIDQHILKPANGAKIRSIIDAAQLPRS